MSEEEGQSDSGPDPIKRSPLKNFVKEQTDMRAGSDALDELEAELLYISEILWKEASHQAQERGLETVQKQDIRQAYDQLFAPHNMLLRASNQLEDVSDKLERLAHDSPVYKTWESYEDE